MNSTRRIVLVDGPSETETVLSAVLGPRGTRVDRVRGHQISRLAKNEPVPDVVVVDLDEETSQVEQAWPEQPRIFLGTLKIADGTESNDADSRGARRLAKPFHYAELIQTLEDLLEHNPAA